MFLVFVMGIDLRLFHESMACNLLLGGWHHRLLDSDGGGVGSPATAVLFAIEVRSDLHGG